MGVAKSRTRLSDFTFSPSPGREPPVGPFASYQSSLCPSGRCGPRRNHHAPGRLWHNRALPRAVRRKLPASPRPSERRPARGACREWADPPRRGLLGARGLPGERDVGGLPWQRAAGRARDRCGPETQAAAERRGFEGGGWFRYCTAAAEPGRRGQEKPHGSGAWKRKRGVGAKGGSAASQAASSEGRKEEGRRARKVQGIGEEGRNDGAGLPGKAGFGSHITKQTVGDPTSRRRHAAARHAPSPSEPRQTRTVLEGECICSHDRGGTEWSGKGERAGRTPEPRAELWSREGPRGLLARVGGSLTTRPFLAPRGLNHLDFPLLVRDLPLG